MGSTTFFLWSTTVCCVRPQCQAPTRNIRNIIILPMSSPCQKCETSIFVQKTNKTYHYHLADIGDETFLELTSSLSSTSEIMCEPASSTCMHQGWLESVLELSEVFSFPLTLYQAPTNCNNMVVINAIFELNIIINTTLSEGSSLVFLPLR